MDRSSTIHDDGDLDGMENRSQAIRTDLADTVEELRSRLSPETIKNDVKSQVVRSGQEMLGKLERSARENPLQTAAIAAGVAYPIWSIMRSIPAPILLMGAGVALAGRGIPGTGGASTRSSTTSDLAADLSGKVTSGLSAARSTVRATAHDASEGMSNLAASAVDTVTGTTADIKAKVTGVASDAASTVTGLAASAADLASDTYAQGTEAISDAGRKVASAGRQGRDTLLETIDRNPLVVAGLMALAGAALAACIPVSRTEDRMLGRSSDRLKEKATTIAKDTARSAYDAGERVVSEVVSAAEDQGLTTEAATEAVRDVADRAATVLDTAVEMVKPNDAERTEQTV
jgi:ElaB/YqjD/DUF883 family membrane-anchored ribosome-binding protein